MTPRTDRHLPGIAARWPFICARCEQARPQGARIYYHRGVPICVECAPGQGDA